MATLRGLRFDTIVILGVCLDKPIVQQLKIPIHSLHPIVHHKQ